MSVMSIPFGQAIRRDFWDERAATRPSEVERARKLTVKVFIVIERRAIAQRLEDVEEYELLSMRRVG